MGSKKCKLTVPYLPVIPTENVPKTIEVNAQILRTNARHLSPGHS
jgi:hypothetical protein